MPHRPVQCGQHTIRICVMHDCMEGNLAVTGQATIWKGAWMKLLSPACLRCIDGIGMPALLPTECTACNT